MRAEVREEVVVVMVFGFVGIHGRKGKERKGKDGRESGE